MNTIFLTPTARLIYDAVHAATAGGTLVFAGHLRVEVDHAQVSREIARMVRLGVLASELIDPQAPRHGRRMRVLVPPAMLETAGRRRRRRQRPKSAAAEPSDDIGDDAPEAIIERWHATWRRDREMRRFEAAWSTAFPHGADYRCGVYPPPLAPDLAADE